MAAEEKRKKREQMKLLKQQVSVNLVGSFFVGFFLAIEKSHFFAPTS